VLEEMGEAVQSQAVDLDLSAGEANGIDGEHDLESGYTRLRLHSLDVFTLEKAAAALLGRTVSRRLEAPPGVRIVAVGGATFGGSGKTPLAIACARELAASGARVAFVGHAYRADPRRARVATPDDDLGEVGDEALLAARALARSGVNVVVAPSRQDAIDRAARTAEVLVLDGIAQLTPVPAALSLLAVDPEHPWGLGRSLRSGDALRAPIKTLVLACDAIVTVGDGPPAAELSEVGRTVWPSQVDSRGVWIRASVDRAIDAALGGGRFEAWVDEGTLMTWRAVEARRAGVLTAMARPERLIAALDLRGIVPRAIVSVRDHGPFGDSSRCRVEEAMAAGGVDLWLATPKCALHAARAMPALPVAVVDQLVTLHPALRRRLRGLAASREQEMAAP
jgi:tetraacyldisaccharide-1-P 4'-kinase